MRSNLIYFAAATVLFTVIYIVVAFSNIRSNPDSHSVWCLEGIDPTIICGGVSFAFFLICTKRYTNDEAYLYGQSRRTAFLSAMITAFVYSTLFACYALGVALLVRRSVLSAPNLAVSADLYLLSVKDILCNLIFLVIVNLIAYEAANILRKFKSWKFWITFIVCIAAFVVLYIFIVAIPQSKNIANFEFWGAMFAVCVPQLLIMSICDFLMARGRLCR